MTTADLTADVVVLAPDENDKLHILLIRRSWDSDAEPGKLALPGGYLDDGERAHTAALRELAEETGIALNDDALEPLGYQDQPDRDPRGRVISFPFVALLEDMPAVHAADDAIDYTWAPVRREDREGPLAFDHDDIVTRAHRHPMVNRR